jgi:hypothetical protein
MEHHHILELQLLLLEVVMGERLIQIQQVLLVVLVVVVAHFRNILDLELLVDSQQDLHFREQLGLLHHLDGAILVEQLELQALQ